MNKITNPFLQQIISGIVQKTTDGRMTDMSWNALNEAKKSKKKVLKREAKEPVKPEDEEKPEEIPQEPESPAQEPAQQEAPPSNQTPQKAAAPVAPEAPAEAPSESPEGGQEDVQQAQADAVASKAELEKAKAEKDQAEKDLKKNSYIKLNSTGGVNFLLGKILDHAFKTDSIDGLAGEMVQKLKIQSPEDFQAFSEETAPYRVLPGMGELLTSMQSMATKKQDVPDNDAGDQPEQTD